MCPEASIKSLCLCEIAEHLSDPAGLCHACVIPGRAVRFALIL